VKRKELCGLKAAFFLLGGFLSMGSALALDCVKTPKPAPLTGPLQKALQLDTNKGLKEPVGCMYQMAFGTLIDPGCFEVNTKRNKLNPTEVVRGFERWISTTTESFLSCRERYPELDLYLKDWVHLMRRSTFECLDQTTIEFGHRAYASAPHNTIEFAYDLLGPVLKRSDATWKFKETGSEKRLLVHEVAHFTKANSGLDHAKLGMTSVDQKNFCSPDLASDRVNVIGYLCSGTGFPERGIPTPPTQLFYEKIEKCPGWCEDVFGKDSFIQSIFGYSSGLEPYQIDSLCTKIRNQGFCEEDPLTVLRHVKKFEELGKKLRARFLKVMPRDSSELPLELINSFPDLKSGYESLRNSSCFKKAFATTVDGAALLPRADVQGLSFTDPLRAFVTKGLDHHMQPIHAAALSALDLKSDIVCTSSADRKAVLDWVNEVKDRTNFATKTKDGHIWGLWQDMIEFAADQKPPEKVSYCLSCDGSKNQLTQDFKTFFGDKLFEEYEAVMRVYHPRSDDFDCAKAGITPENYLAESTEKLLKSLQNIGPIKDCPTCPSK